MMKRKRPGYLKLYLMDLLILIMAYGGFYRCRLANSDTLWGELRPDYALDSEIINFRWGAFLLDTLSYRTGIYPYEHQTFFIILFIVVLAAALLILQLIFIPLFPFSAAELETLTGSSEQEESYRIHPEGNSRMPGAGEEICWIGFIAITALCFVNVLFSEYFYFTQSFLTYKGAILLCLLGCLLYRRKHYLWGSVLLLLMPSFYQIDCLWAALILMTAALLEEKGRFSKKLIRKELTAILVPFASGFLNYATGPALVSMTNRLTGLDLHPAKTILTGSVSEIIGSMIPQFRLLYESSLELMAPVYIPFLFSVAVIGITLILLVRRRMWNELGTFVLYEVISFAVMCSLQIMSSAEDFTPRIICPFYVMQSMHALATLSLAADYKICRDLTACLSVLYLCIQIFFLQIIIENRVLSENLDTICAETILDKVDQYERETGITVTRASFCNDPDCAPYYPEVYYHRSAINRRLYGDASYTITETMAEKRGKHFELVYDDDIVYRELFGSTDWDTFNPDEQVIIRGNTLYVCSF